MSSNIYSHEAFVGEKCDSTYRNTKNLIDPDHIHH